MEAGEDFHPRFSPHKKVYEYRIGRSRIPDPLKRLYCFPFSFPLSLSEMRLAAEELVGEHDFRSFANPDSQVLMHGGAAVRTLYELSLREEGEELILHFEGSGFLYHMIRILTGTLLEIGSGRRRAAEIPATASGRTRACRRGEGPQAGRLHRSRKGALPPGALLRGRFPFAGGKSQRGRAKIKGSAEMSCRARNSHAEVFGSGKEIRHRDCFAVCHPHP